MNRRLALLLLLLLAALASGCASAPFAAAVKQTVPVFTGELRAYVTADAGIDTAAKADRISSADALDAAVKAKMVTLPAVKAAWEPVRPVYSAYVDSDADLSPEEKTLRAGNMARMDRLIEVESGRWIYGGGR